MNWVEEGGVGWSWVEVGARFCNTLLNFTLSTKNVIYLMKKKINLSHTQKQTCSCINCSLQNILAKLTS